MLVSKAFHNNQGHPRQSPIFQLEHSEKSPGIEVWQETFQIGLTIKW